MQKETRTRFITLTLGFLLLFLYIAAKVDFFRRFSYFETGTYLREHSIYWLAMAVVAFLIWLMEKRSRSSS
jgi:hypothetical protein